MSYKRLVHALPGPVSYCKCTSLCSKPTVEHVVPKSFMKQQNKKGNSNDLHNLYSCCQKLNSQKGSKLFAKEFILSESHHTGALARSCLYMKDTYSLKIPKQTVLTWYELHKVHEPYEFEFERDSIIEEQTGKSNRFLHQWENDTNIESLFKGFT